MAYEKNPVKNKVGKAARVVGQVWVTGERGFEAEKTRKKESLVI